MRYLKTYLENLSNEIKKFNSTREYCKYINTIDYSTMKLEDYIKDIKDNNLDITEKWLKDKEYRNILWYIPCDILYKEYDFLYEMMKIDNMIYYLFLDMLHDAISYDEKISLKKNILQLKKEKEFEYFFDSMDLGLL